jgi:hypothetical protein
MCVLSESELALIFLTGHLEVLNAALTSVEGEKRGLDAPDVWAQYMKKCMNTGHEGMHDFVTQYAVIFLERPPTDVTPEDLHTLGSPLPACTTQLLSRLLDTLHAAVPHLPDAHALTVLLTQLPLTTDHIKICISSAKSCGLAQTLRKPRPPQTKPKPGLLGQAGPEHH